MIAHPTGYPAIQPCPCPMFDCINQSQPAPIVAIAVRKPGEREVGYLRAFLDTGADRSVLAPHTLPFLEEFFGQLDVKFFATPGGELSLALNLEFSFDGGQTWFATDDWVELSESTADYPGLPEQEDLLIGRDLLHQVTFCCNGQRESLSLRVEDTSQHEPLPGSF